MRFAAAEVDLEGALRTSARYVDEKAVKTLIDAGANPDDKDGRGKTARDEAWGAEKRGVVGGAATRKALDEASWADPAAEQAPVAKATAGKAK